MPVMCIERLKEAVGYTTFNVNTVNTVFRFMAIVLGY